jgi:hypothetical protein
MIYGHLALTASTIHQIFLAQFRSRASIGEQAQNTDDT